MAEFFFIGFESYDQQALVAQLPSICAQVVGDGGHPPAIKFPCEIPEPYWSGWPSVSDPPPLDRARAPARCPRWPEWEQPDYDAPAWAVLYEMSVRMTHIGDFDMMDLYPLSGVDPIIVREPELALDHSLPVDARPPMGLAVARLLARQIAYDYACEHGRHQVAAWIFAHLNQQAPPEGAQAPGWVTPALSTAFTTLRPDAALAFCTRAFEDLDRLCVS
ncbi:hypothetical protein [Haliangium sp.]|uniref:hypothetical protein n=1 Tax=Haliangium sp. TaxID=2663208 RepID=UPI003D11B5C9